MYKYLLSILTAGVIASVLQAQTLTPIALELWEFDDAPGKSFQGVNAASGNGFANTGSNGSSWNFGSFGSPVGAQTDGDGNLVIGGGQDGNVSRKIAVPYNPPLTTGIYRLTLDIASVDNLTAGGVQFEAAGGAGASSDRIAMIKLDHDTSQGWRVQATIRSTGSDSNDWFYRAKSLADIGPNTPVSCYIEFDLDADTAQFYVDGELTGGTAENVDTANLTMVKFSQNGTFVSTNSVKIDSMGLYRMVDQASDTDGDGIADYYESNTGTWVSPTDTGTDPAVAEIEVAGVDIALYNYIVALNSSTGSVGGGAITQEAYDAVVAEKDAAEAAQATAEAAQATAETAQATAEAALANAPTLADVEQTVMDARAGSTRIDVSDGVASITLTLEETSAVSDWSSATTSEQTFQVNAPAGTSFYRFKIAD
ncbi:MAG: hypothetical protein VXZ08_02590 [Verrucomicrobiota bacterium]|nr:hypothetical protein [Verrucomicrobiota bacterium]